MRAIFISYRREDSQGEAGRLFDDLTSAFQEQDVFMDVDAISPGRDFRKAIEESVRDCSVLLAMVGPEWVTCASSNGTPRLADPADFVRVEIAEALRRDIPVIPVLVRGARMPTIEQLPPELSDFAFRNAVELGHARWRSDVQLLIRALRPLVGAASAENSTAAAQATPQARVHFPSSPPSVVPYGVLEPIMPPAAPPVAAPRPSTTNPASAIEANDLDRLTRELAAYIGPIAEVVVRRAARRCGTLLELSHLAAQEIEPPADRARFLAVFNR